MASGWSGVVSYLGGFPSCFGTLVVLSRGGGGDHRGLTPPTGIHLDLVGVVVEVCGVITLVA